MKAWILAGALLLTAGCKNAPSEDQCKRALDHLVDLEFKKAGADGGNEALKADLEKQKTAVASAKGAEFMDICVNKTAKGRVECVLVAQDLDAVAKCDEQK